MTARICRDCGIDTDEEPEDPAPGLCPPCYEKRLMRIGAKFDGMQGSLKDPRLVAAWLEEALIDIGGELPEYAHQHAHMMFMAAMAMDAIGDLLDSVTSVTSEHLN